MKLTKALCFLALFAASVAIANAKPGNPYCPKQLTSEKARYKCYSKTIYTILLGVWSTNFDNLVASSNVFRPWLTDDLQGRGAPGAFVGIDLNAEYLAVAWPAFIAGKIGDKPDLLYFTSSGNVVSFQQNFLIHDPTINRSANWTIIAFARFTADQNLLSQYDLDFRWFLEFLQELEMYNLPANETQMMQIGLAQALCNRTMELCVGSNQQWDSYDECFQYLSVKPFIENTGRIAGNCLLCRNIHSILLPFDLSLHCPHVGPSGPQNSACTDQPLAAYHSFFAPYLFISKKQWLDIDVPLPLSR